MNWKQPPLLHSHSHFFFQGCAHKHLYQYVVQRDLVWLKRAMYCVSDYTVHCITWHGIHCMLKPDKYWYGCWCAQPSKKKWLQLCNRERWSLCGGGSVAAMCTHTRNCWCVIWNFNILWWEWWWIAPEILVGPTNFCCW